MWAPSARNGRGSACRAVKRSDGARRLACSRPALVHELYPFVAVTGRRRQFDPVLRSEMARENFGGRYAAFSPHALLSDETADELLQ